MPSKTMYIEGDDLMFNMFDIPVSDFYVYSDIDQAAAIPINDHLEDTCELLTSDEKYLSTSPSTFLNTTFSTSPPANGWLDRTDQKYQLRNHDCMWSGRCNNPESHQKLKHQQKLNQILHKNNSKLCGFGAAVPKGGHNGQTVSANLVRHQVQAGQSLLLNSRLNSKASNSSLAQKVPQIVIGKNSSSGDEKPSRPDTPLSLCDREDFKNSGAFACTTTGSNSLPLSSGQKEEEINRIKEFLLQSTTSTSSTGFEDTCTTLNDIVSTQEFKDFDSSTSGKRKFRVSLDDDGGDSDDSTTEDGDDEYEEDFINEEEDEGIEMTNMGSRQFDEDDEEGILSANETMDDDQMVDSEESGAFTNDHGEDDDESDNSYSSMENAAKQLIKVDNNSTTMHHQQTMHSDHSYTRCKTRVDIQNLGVDTPSDSEEEIDVVGVGDKNLPTNPSAKDRRVLQSTVADRIAAARKTASSANHLIHGKADFNKHINNSFIRSGNSARQISKRINSNLVNGCEDIVQYSHHQHDSSNISSSKRSVRIISNNSNSKKIANHHHQNVSNSRKRPHSSSVKSKSIIESKRSRHSIGGQSVKKLNGHSQKKSRDYESVSSSNCTLEKRNLHNNLERQRRIGLKNLFDELKIQIPSLRDKDRAPKVVILREATTLCHQLTRDQDSLAALKRQRERLIQTLNTLRCKSSRIPNKIK